MEIPIDQFLREGGVDGGGGGGGGKMRGSKKQNYFSKSYSAHVTA